MRAVGPSYMSRRQKASLAEPKSFQEARQTMTAATVQKFFPATDDFPGGTFNGTIAGVDGKIAQEDGSVLCGVYYRVEYEDGDAEHLQWPELKQILLSLPARDTAEAHISPPVVSKPKRTASKTGAACADTAKKQKRSPAGADSAKKQKASPAGADSAKKQKVSPAGADSAKKQKVLPAVVALGSKQKHADTETSPHEDETLECMEKPSTTITKRPRSKRQRAVKPWLDEDDNDENDGQAANTPLTVKVITTKKLRTVGPTPHASNFTVKKELGRSTVKKELGKSAIKKGVEKFTVEERLPEDGSPGQLKKVNLVNFMCHEHFEMDFCPHINFVSGQNGSGKSAVLQAIQQVLGVRASATNRASTQKEFIRKGAHEAVISVTLWNKGEEAYQPEKWGSFISIERRIGQSSSWSMKDAKGRKREENRASLDGILEALNLNGSNPIAVMTQDISRSFLAGSNEKSDRKKFDIYMEATLLAHSQENYQIAKADLQKIAASLSQAQGVYKALKAKRAELNKAVEALQLMSDWQDEETQIMRGLAWATVGDMEPKLQRLEQSIEHLLPGKLQKIEACLEPAQKRVEELEKQYQDQLASMAAFNDNLQCIGSETKALQAVHLTAKGKLREEEQKVEALKTEIAEHTTNRDVMVSSVAQTQQSQDFLASQAATQKLQEQLTQTQQDCEAAAADERAQDQGYREAMGQLNLAVSKVDTVLKPIVERLGGEVQDLQMQIHRYNQGVTHKLNLFGDNAKKLQSAIQRVKDFHHKPIGPIGFYLGLSDERWKDVAESHLGGKLNAYVLHDHHDLNVFKRVCKQLRIPLPYVTIARFDVPQHHIPGTHRHSWSLMDVLKCTEKKMGNVVLNFIIDVAHPEKTALCQSDDEARSLAAQPQVWNAYIPDGSKFVQRGQTSTFIPGSQRFPRLGGDVQSQLHQTHGQLEQKQAEMESAKSDLQKAQVHYQQCLRNAAAAKRQKHTASNFRSEVDSQYMELLTQSQADMSVSNDDEDEVERDLRELNQTLIQMQQELMSAQAECDRARATEEEALTTWVSKREEGGQLEEDNARITSEIEQKKAGIEEVKAQLQYYEGHQREVTHKLEAQRSNQEAAKNLLDSNIEKAMQMCSREEGDAALEGIKQKLLDKDFTEEGAEQSLSTEALTQALGKLRTKMTHQEKENGGKGEDILLRHAEVQSQCKEHKERLQKLQSTYYMLKTACEKRMSDLHRIDRSLEESVNQRFNFYMYKKGHTGMIKVKRATEDKPGTLEIKVRIGGNNADTGNVKDLKQLSGGEKSYTTVAFALALGEWTQSPFRAMDEFDVFMDAINRRVAMENLFSNSLEHPDLQFIFLTPQDINAVEEAKKNLAARGNPMPEGYCQVVLMRPAREA